MRKDPLDFQEKSTAQIDKMSTDERAEYNEGLKAYRDMNSARVTYYNEGKKIGYEIGLKEGRKIYLREFIINVYNKLNYEAEAIAKITKLSVNEVKEILNSDKKGEHN